MTMTMRQPDRGFLTGDVKRAEDYPADDHRHGALRLDAAELATLDAALAPGKVAGKRYSDRITATIHR